MESEEHAEIESYMEKDECLSKSSKSGAETENDKSGNIKLPQTSVFIIQSLLNNPTHDHPPFSVVLAIYLMMKHCVQKNITNRE